VRSQVVEDAIESGTGGGDVQAGVKDIPGSGKLYVKVDRNRRRCDSATPRGVTIFTCLRSLSSSLQSTSSVVSGIVGGP
jgi:hypothetical protein